jgi:hypothetical protein
MIETVSATTTQILLQALRDRPHLERRELGVVEDEGTAMRLERAAQIARRRRIEQPLRPLGVIRRRVGDLQDVAEQELKAQLDRRVARLDRNDRVVGKGMAYVEGRPLKRRPGASTKPQSLVEPIEH